MAARRQRRFGFHRRFPDHRVSEARAFSAHLRDLHGHYGPLEGLAADYAELVAFLRVNLAGSMARLAEAQQKRETGTGRRPSVYDIGRLLKRVGLEFGSYDQALRRLEELAQPRRATQPADLIHELRARDGARG
jgi:hypothetical protein